MLGFFFFVNVCARVRVRVCVRVRACVLREGILEPSSSEFNLTHALDRPESLCMFLFV